MFNLTWPTGLVPLSELKCQKRVADDMLLGILKSISSATRFWHFNSLNGTNPVGHVRLNNTSNQSSLYLVGNGYLKQAINSTRVLKNLTVAAWVKPDYSQGSPEFTVIGKENQFALSINNIIAPSQIATFSIYDGIKWNTVNSTVQIPEGWTYLVGTYNGSSISIYVNGTLQSTLTIPGNPTLTEDGSLVPKTPSSISSDADVVIGATFNSNHGVPQNRLLWTFKRCKSIHTAFGLKPES